MIPNPWNSSTPPNGWHFRQPQMGWEMPAPVSQTVRSAVTAILKMRLKNPALTSKHNLSTNPDHIEEELIKFNAARLGVDLSPTIPFTVPRRSLPQSVEVAVAAVKKTAQGASVLLEWEESGLPPVDKETAEKRASICVQCPKNGKGDFTRWYTIPVSEMLRKRMQRVHSMNLTTTHDESIGVCEACLCPLRLKVWTPMSVIKKNLTDQQSKELWGPCWILKPQLP